LDDWTNNLDQGKQIDVIYTDFEKAFDKVPHYGLLCKLKEYHLDHRLLHWITDFLCNRKQRVRVNGCYSQWYRVESGIPQGQQSGYLSLGSHKWLTHNIGLCFRDSVTASQFSQADRFFSVLVAKKEVFWPERQLMLHGFPLVSFERRFK